ncbi:MAG TPA: hypothetical protein ENN67_06270, partial [Firmicutes bacterium]|nr:hypothetical protein [Bacillota bacterium]
FQFFSSRISNEENKIRFEQRYVFFNFVTAFLVVVGFRVNELYLPGIREPESIAGNIGLLLTALIFGYIFIYLTRRLFFKSLKIPPWILGPVLFLLPFILGSIHARFFSPKGFAFDSPNVILLTLDTVRADRLGFFGNNENVSPNIGKFALKNQHFTNCRTPMPLTSPAHATLFSGLLPNEHGVFTNYISYPDSPEIPCIAEELREKGYFTCAFPSVVHMSKNFNFDRGFILYNQSTLLEGPSWIGDYLQFAPFAILSRLGIVRETFLNRNSRQVNQSFFNWLDNSTHVKYSLNPFFAWIHYFDAHAPYQPPDEYWKRYDPDYSGSMTGSQEELDRINENYMDDWNPGDLPEGITAEDIENLRARYDGEISYLDESFGELIDGLKARGLWENTVIITVSDHGEGLFDDGYFGHNFTLKEYEILTALAIKGPGILCPSDADISLVDVALYMRKVTGLDSDSSEIKSALMLSPGYIEMTDYKRVGMVYLKSHCWIDPPFKLVR